MQLHDAMCLLCHASQVRTASIVLRLGLLAGLTGAHPSDVAGVSRLEGELGVTLSQLSQLVDRAGARRVLLGALSIAGAVASAEKAQQSAGFSEESTEVNEEGSMQGKIGTDEEGGPLDSDLDMAVAEDEDSASQQPSQLTQPEQASQLSQPQPVTAVTGEAFSKAWLSQAGREGVLGALVALGEHTMCVQKSTRLSFGDQGCSCTYVLGPPCTLEAELGCLPVLGLPVCLLLISVHTAVSWPCKAARLHALCWATSPTQVDRLVTCSCGLKRDVKCVPLGSSLCMQRTLTA